MPRYDRDVRLRQMRATAARNREVSEYLRPHDRSEWQEYVRGQELGSARKEALVGMADSNRRMMENLTGGEQEEFKAYLNGSKELTDERLWELTAKANESEEKRKGQTPEE